jgi:methylaspartate ammonia-lyase
MTDLHPTSRLALGHSAATLIHTAAARTAAEILAKHDDTGIDAGVDAACREFRDTLLQAIASVGAPTR